MQVLRYSAAKTWNRIDCAIHFVFLNYGNKDRLTYVSKLAGLEGSPKCKIIKVTSSHTYSVNTEDAKLNKLIFIFSGTISDMNFNINNQQMLTDGTEVLFINSSDRCNIYLKNCVISDSNYKVGGGCICTAYKITPYPSVSRYLLQSSWNDTAW